MRNYIILNGVNSNTITGLLISTLPPITKPKIRTQTEEIDGRDGDIVTKLGYSAYEKEFQIGLYGDFDIDEVIAYFNSEGTVVFSNEEDKYYNYQILDQIDYEKLIRFKTASIKMHVQPFKYPLEEEQIQVDATVVSGEGSNISLQYTNPNTVITSEIEGDTYQETTTGKNLCNGVNQNCFINATATNAGIASGNSGLYIAVDGSTYTVSTTTTQTRYRVACTNSLPTSTSQTTYNGQNKDNTSSSITINTNGHSYLIVNATDLTKIQIEKGSTATPYEEYTGGIPSPNPDYPQEIEVVTGEQSITVCGKNLVDFSNSVSWRYASGLPSTATTSSMITSQTSNSYSITYTSNQFLGVLSSTMYLKPNTQYTISFNRPQNTNFAQRLHIYNISKNGIYSLNEAINTNVYGTPYTKTFTTGETGITAFMISVSSSNPKDQSETITNIQLEEGSEVTDFQTYQSQSYTINLGNTELCKIGDYQDRIYQDEGTWYIQKQIDKVVLNGSENWGLNQTQTNTLRFGNTNILQNSLVTSNNKIICNMFTTSVTQDNDDYEHIRNAIREYPTYLFVLINKTRLATQDVAGFKSWLSTHNTTVYYVLETPTATEITDTDLIAQLNALAGAYTYENTTNISVTGSLPAILKATTQGMPKTIINNIGNIYAKPLITIYGSGNIGVYLNQIQVLQIALGDSGSITIDVSKMEAYNKNTQALMNRLVTGDYMKFLINSGENEIAFSGNVAGFTMDNYTRWL